jgi:hypothetical protein
VPAQRPRRWRVAASAITASLLALRLAALVQTGCAPLRTDERWRATVRARAETLDPAVTVGERVGWVRRFTLPAPFTQVCDLASTPRGLVAAASIDALGVDGAALYRWDDGPSPRELLRWDGQGFLRVHAWGDTLVVPDADAPFHLLPFAFDLDVDGYVFVSSPDGTLSRRQREVLPATYHVFDAARLADGRLVASTGAYRPRDVPYIGHVAPAALFVDDGPGRPWRRALEHPSPEARGVHRFTYLLSLPDGALLAATESPSGPGAVRIESAGAAPTARPVEGLGGYVLRWAAWRGAVFAVVQRSTGAALLRSDDGGLHFTTAAYVHDPQSLVPAGDTLYLLARGELYRSDDGVHFTALVHPHPALAHVPSSLVSAPLVAHRGSLWAASTTTGEVFEVR